MDSLQVPWLWLGKVLWAASHAVFALFAGSGVANPGELARGACHSMALIRNVEPVF